MKAAITTVEDSWLSSSQKVSQTVIQKYYLKIWKRLRDSIRKKKADLWHTGDLDMKMTTDGIPLNLDMNLTTDSLPLNLDMNMTTNGLPLNLDTNMSTNGL